MLKTLNILYLNWDRERAGPPQTPHSSYTMKQRNNNDFIWAEEMGFWFSGNHKKFTVETEGHDLFEPWNLWKRWWSLRQNRKYMNRFAMKTMCFLEYQLKLIIIINVYLLIRNSQLQLSLHCCRSAYLISLSLYTSK